MRVKYLFLNALFSFLIPFSAIASDWVYVGFSKVLKTYVDKQSIKGDPTSREFWEKMELKKEEIDSVSGKYYIRTMQYVEIDCNNSIQKLHQMTLYAIDEKVIDSINFSPPHVTRTTPDSVGEAVEEYVCSFKPTK